MVRPLKEAIISLQLPVWPNFTFFFSSVLSLFFFSQCSLAAVPLTLRELTIQGQHLAEENQHKSQRGTQPNKPTYGNSERASESETIYFFLFPPVFFSSAFFPSLRSTRLSSLTNTPHPGKPSLLLPSPACHMRFQSANLAFAPPRELQASVTLSYTRHVKKKQAAS